MSIEAIGDIVRRIRAEGPATEEPGSERERLLRAAQEFESMLMLQMLKEMRKAGSWADEDEEKGYGAETMLETIDVELASHLSKAQGLGLGRQLLELLAPAEAEASPPRGDSGPGVIAVAGAEVAVRVSERNEARGAVDGAATGPAAIDLPAGKVTSAFGWRSDPFHGSARFHRGIDIRAAYGQDVPAAGAGRVVSAGADGGYGESVVIEHAGGVRTRYAHLSAATVAPGEVIAEGQVIGRAGQSGRATGTHLHFEVIAASGEPLNPEQFAGLKAGGPAADSTGARNSVLQETRR